MSKLLVAAPSPPRSLKGLLRALPGLWLLGLGLAAPGCASDEAAQKSEPSGETLTARDYYPLAVGNKWTYRASPGEEVREIEIVHSEDGWFVDNNQPPARLQARSTGIFDGDRFLLEDPLEVGHTWMAIPSVSSVEEYEIVSVDARVQTPAGSFSRCVQVRAITPGRTGDGRDMQLIMLWSYAPNVGLVKIEQLVQIGEEPPTSSMQIELIGYEVAAS